MNYQDTINWLYNQFPFYQKEGATAYKKDINHVKQFFDEYGHDHLLFDSIHIGGTNGKGSVAHMLSSILQESGYKVGLFTSPHILDFRERIKINGKKISKDFILNFIQKHKNFFQKLNMSFFEMNVAMAFRFFATENVDVAIIEVGLGGRLDATNIISPQLSIITNISLDHTNLLGNSIIEIAKEKAGIIKKNTPILIGECKHYTQVIEEVASNLDSKVYYSKSYQYDSDLRGFYQNLNINISVTAIDILRNLNYIVDNKSIINGLHNVIKNTKFMGRWQIILDRPLVICDIAHNIDAMKALLYQISKINVVNHIILGFSQDKNIDDMVSILPKNYNYYICDSTNPRIIDIDAISSIFDKHNISYKSFQYSYNAYNYLLDKVDKNDLILITGSVFIVSDMLKYLDKV